jgi:hypothetical protein
VEENGSELVTFSASEEDLYYVGLVFYIGPNYEDSFSISYSDNVSKIMRHVFRVELDYYESRKRPPYEIHYHKMTSDIS